MDDKTAEPAGNSHGTTMPIPYVPHEVVTEILLRLPVASLLRFTRVCRAWHRTISDDPSFQRAHLRRHRSDPCLLIAPRIQAAGNNFLSHIAGLYQWEQDHAYSTAAATALVYPMPVPPFREWAAHALVHCDGLVLVGMESAAWVLNPATRHTVKLPWGRFSTPHSLCYLDAFGLGRKRSPRSDDYKVARFFQTIDPDPASETGFRNIYHVDVFTIGSTDRCWHETVAQPPFRVMRRRTATFFKGSMIWTIDPGCPLVFLQFRLDDETFSFIPPPLCWSRDNHDASIVHELRDDLCLITSVWLPNCSIDMWICTGLDMPRWEKRRNILHDWTQPPRPVALLGDGVLVCRSTDNYLYSCTYQPGQDVAVKHMICMNDLKYYNVGEGTLVEYPSQTAGYIDAIPYVPSFVTI